MPHFGKQLRLLAFQQWRTQYIDFRRLKRQVREMVAAYRAEHPPSSSPAPPPVEDAEEDTPLRRSRMGNGTTLHINERIAEDYLLTARPEDIRAFLATLEEERRRIEEFFSEQLDTAVGRLDRLLAAARALSEKRTPPPEERADDGVPRGIDRSANDASDKHELFDLLLVAEELLDFGRLNLLGFNKIVKKLVKHTGFAGQAMLMRTVSGSSFVKRMPEAEALRDNVKTGYADIFGDRSASFTAADAITELETAVSTARNWKRNTILVQFDEHVRRATLVSIKTDRVNPKRFWVILIAALAYGLGFVLEFADKDDQAAMRCLGIVAAATVLWVTEVWPLFVTALLVPFLVTVSQVLLSENNTVVPPAKAASIVFTKMFPNNVPLILAGFSIAEAFKRYGLDVKIAMAVLRRPFFRTPHRFVIAIELLCFFMSMWISNVAGSVLVLTVIMPIIRGLPPGSRYIKTLLLATAISGNVGGMTTQIASPQNAVSIDLDKYSIDFTTFSAVSLPLTPLLLICGHFVVIMLYKPDVRELPRLDERSVMPTDDIASAAAVIKSARSANAEQVVRERPPWFLRWRVDWKPWAVGFITLLSICLWVSSPWIEAVGKSIGIISLVPLILFFGTGLLSKEQFERLPWALATLIGGGSVLGAAVEQSKLLEIAGNMLLKMPNNLYLITVVSGFIMMLAGSFVSHTVAALILLKLFGHVGEALGHEKLLVMTSIVMCTGAMPLPISSFPNLNSISVENADHRAYLSTIDFLKVGVPMTILAFLGVNSVTYGMCLALNL